MRKTLSEQVQQSDILQPLIGLQVNDFLLDTQNSRGVQYGEGTVKTLESDEDEHLF